MTPLLLAAPEKIKSPSLQYGALSPILIVFGVALAGVLVEAFLPNKYRRIVQPALAITGFATACDNNAASYDTVSAPLMP